MDIYFLTNAFLLKVLDNKIMNTILSILTPKKNASYLNENYTVRQALESFDAHRFTIVPLVDNEGLYTGTLSEGDILRFMKNTANFNLKIAEAVMVKDIDRYRPYKALRVDSLLNEFFSLSLEQNFIPVVDDRGTFIGIIKRKEIIRYLSEKSNLQFND